MNNTKTLLVSCPLCHEVVELEIPSEGFAAWQAGDLIQNALPELCADVREQLISGTCPKCWDEMFGDNTGGDNFMAEAEAAEAILLASWIG